MSSIVRAPGVTKPVVLTELEVAQVLRVSGRTVRRWADAGTLHAIKVGGVRRYRLRDVVALIDPTNDNAPGGQTEREVTTPAGHGRRDEP